MAVVVERHLGDGSLPHVDANYAMAQHGDTAGVQQQGTLQRSEALIQELESADVLVIGTPMHNLGLPSVLKAWIDHVVQARRSFSIGPAGKIGLLRDRPVFVAVASGGIFSGPNARQPDFLTPYLKIVLDMIGLKDLRFFTVEGTGHGPLAVAEARARADQALAAHFGERGLVRQASPLVPLS